MKYYPEGLTELTNIILGGKYNEFNKIKEATFKVMTEYESILLDKGYQLDYSTF